MNSYDQVTHTQAMEAVKEIAATLKEIKDELAAIRASMASIPLHLTTISGAPRK